MPHNLIQKANGLLGALTADAFAMLEPALEPTTFALGQVLSECNAPYSHAYFHASGLTSILIGPLEPNGVEVGVVSRDGMVGVAAVLGAGRSPHLAIVQIAGEGWRIPVPMLLAAVEANVEIRHLLLRYAHCFLVQVSSTAFANARLSVEARLARWLLMCEHRTGNSEIPLTHEFLAKMLGVRRPGVTVATHVLEGEGMIRASRGRLTVLDREKLKKAAGQSYGIAEAEQARLLRPAEGGDSD